MASKVKAKLALQLRETGVSANKVYASHRISKKSQNGVLDEWLLDKPGDDFRSMIMELMELRCDGRSTIFCTQYQKKDWHSGLRGRVHADATMDRIVLNAVWLESGEVNMRAHENETEQHRLLEAAPAATMTAVAGNHSQFHWKLKPITKVIMRANTQFERQSKSQKTINPLFACRTSSIKMGLRREPSPKKINSHLRCAAS